MIGAGWIGCSDGGGGGGITICGRIGSGMRTCATAGIANINVNNGNAIAVPVRLIFAAPLLPAAALPIGQLRREKVAASKRSSRAWSARYQVLDGLRILRLDE